MCCKILVVILRIFLDPMVTWTLVIKMLNQMNNNKVNNISKKMGLSLRKEMRFLKLNAKIMMRKILN